MVACSHRRTQAHFASLQDDWKLLPRLTLNLGVRHEYAIPYYEQKNQQANFNPAMALPSPLNSFLAASSGDKYTIDPDANHFAPRLGLAYAIDANSAFRGGYGIGYSPTTAPARATSWPSLQATMRSRTTTSPSST